jgi:hypothetical protein
MAVQTVSSLGELFTTPAPVKPPTATVEIVDSESSKGEEESKKPESETNHTNGTPKEGEGTDRDESKGETSLAVHA